MGYTAENYYMVNGLEDLSYLLNQRNTRVFLWNLENNLFIDGFLNMQGGTVLQGTSSWETSGNSSISDTVNYGWGALTTGSAFVTKSGTSPISQAKLRIPHVTTVDWKDGGRFVLNLGIGFYSFTKEDDVSKKVADIMKGVYPDIYLEGSYITAPLGYKKTIPLAAKIRGLIGSGSASGFLDRRAPLSNMLGCWGITIGNWFTTPAVFVMNQASFNMSSEQTIYGKPLYSWGNVEMLSAIIVGYTDIMSWMGVGTEE
ncbi:MAG TPA: hypothetical protein PLH90_02065 [Candidatus Paceibacterota bacterium]|nr:hypothetical protein [Candidatus Paceibacterota bacterium]